MPVDSKQKQDQRPNPFRFPKKRTLDEVLADDPSYQAKATNIHKNTRGQKRMKVDSGSAASSQATVMIKTD